MTVLWPWVLLAATLRMYGLLLSPRSGTSLNVTDPEEPVHIAKCYYRLYNYRHCIYLCAHSQLGLLYYTSIRPYVHFKLFVLCVYIQKESFRTYLYINVTLHAVASYFEAGRIVYVYM